MISKKVLLFALIFAVYHFLVHFFLGVQEFYLSSFSSGAILGLQVVTVFLFQVCIQVVLIKFNRKDAILKASTYTISSLFTALVFFLLFIVYREYYLSFFAAFLITGTVYSLFYFLFQFFNALNQNSTIVSLPTVLENSTEEKMKVFNLTDSRGKTRLSIQLDAIICFEANDNYVAIYYEDTSEKLIKKLERISMKRIEEFLGEDNTKFLRIHKSFIINTNFILQVVGKAQSQKVRLKHLNEELPVSRKINISDYIA